MVVIVNVSRIVVLPGGGGTPSLAVGVEMHRRLGQAATER